MKLVHRLQLSLILPAFAWLLPLPFMRQIVDATYTWPEWWFSAGVVAFDVVAFAVVFWLTGLGIEE